MFSSYCSVLETLFKQHFIFRPRHTLVIFVNDHAVYIPNLLNVLIVTSVSSRVPLGTLSLQIIITQVIKHTIAINEIQRLTSHFDSIGIQINQ